MVLVVLNIYTDMNTIQDGVHMAKFYPGQTRQTKLDRLCIFTIETICLHDELSNANSWVR